MFKQETGLIWVLELDGQVASWDITCCCGYLLLLYSYLFYAVPFHRRGDTASYYSKAQGQLFSIGKNI